MLPQQHFTVPLFVEGQAAAKGDRIAIIARGEQRTYAEFNRRINQASNALAARGLRRGDRLGLATTNRIEHLELALGALKSGMTIAPLSLLLMPETMAKLLRDAQIKALVVEANLPLARTELHEQIPTLLPEGLILLDDRRSIDILLEGSGTDAPAVQIAAEDDCTIIYSSGTTGVPKGIIHSHLGRSIFGLGFAAEFAMNETTVCVLTTPICSNASWMMMVPTFFAGGTLVFMDGFDPRSFLQAVEAHRATHCFLVPTQIDQLLDFPSLEEFDRSSLKAVVSAGSKLRIETKRRLCDFTGHGFYEVYGTTEGAGTLLKPSHLPEKIESVGPPAACGEIRIVNDDGEELPPGSRGEIVGRNPFCSRGYLNRSDLNVELVWHDSSGRLFFRTGDIGYLDEDGFLYVVDRKKDMILSGGLNVYASDIEAVMSKHPAIGAVAVVAAPHEKWGETPHAFVELREGVTEGVDELCAWTNSRLNRHERISGITVVPSLPRNTLQKIMKHELKKVLWT